MIPSVKLDAIQVLAISCLGIVIGIWLKRKIAVLDKLNIPAPIIGGLIYGAILMEVPGQWIAVGAIVMLGLAVLTGVKVTRQKDAA